MPFERYVAQPAQGSASMIFQSGFPSDNHFVRFGALSSGLPDISRVTAYRAFGGRVREAHRSRRDAPDNPQNPTPDNFQNDRPSLSLL
jgi:hypothetical protein